MKATIKRVNSKSQPKMDWRLKNFPQVDSKRRGDTSSETIGVHIRMEIRVVCKRKVSGVDAAQLGVIQS